MSTFVPFLDPSAGYNAPAIQHHRHRATGLLLPVWAISYQQRRELMLDR